MLLRHPTHLSQWCAEPGSKCRVHVDPGQSSRDWTLNNGTDEDINSGLGDAKRPPPSVLVRGARRAQLPQIPDMPDLELDVDEDFRVQCK